ncbi:MAG TPA: hypothetical protein ENL15_02695 [Firmicutes bacterium]|nr:hypothetical protein [Bacillota bacterium]
MKRLEELFPFTEIPPGELPGPFHQDPGGLLFLLFDTPPEGVHDLIDGQLSLGGIKGSPDTIRLVLTVHQDKTPLLLLEQFIAPSREKEDYISYFSQEKQSLAFFYSSEGKRYFILAKQVRLDDSLKKELLAMTNPHYPVIHQVPLSQVKIAPFLKSSYFLYRFEESSLQDPALLRKIDDGALLTKSFCLWTGRGPKGPFLLSDIPLNAHTPEKEGCHPLEMAALPYAFSTSSGILFRILIDRSGLEDLKTKGDRKKYEKAYPFWP